MAEKEKHVPPIFPHSEIVIDGKTFYIALMPAENARAEGQHWQERYGIVIGAVVRFADAVADDTVNGATAFKATVKEKAKAAVKTIKNEPLKGLKLFGISPQDIAVDVAIDTAVTTLNKASEQKDLAAQIDVQRPVALLILDPEHGNKPVYQLRGVWNGNALTCDCHNKNLTGNPVFEALNTPVILEFPKAQAGKMPQLEEPQINALEARIKQESAAASAQTASLPPSPPAKPAAHSR